MVLRIRRAISPYFNDVTISENLLQKLHAAFRRAPCVFYRFRKDWDLIGTQLNRLNTLKHSHKSVIEKYSGFRLHGPKNCEQTIDDHTLFTR